MTSNPDLKSGSAISAIEDEVVFICGALRSGTTLLRLMLDHHPQISNPGEMDFLFECSLDHNGQYDVASYREDLRDQRIFNAHSLEIDEGLDYPGLLRSFLARLKQPGRLLTINIHRNFDRIPALLPNAKYVHFLRDPRDVARSSIGMGWAGNVYHGVDHWVASEKSIDELKAKVSADQLFQLKNEDLIKDPQNALARLCEFLGVGFDPLMLTYPENSTYKAPDMSLVEQWRRLQTPHEVGLVEGKVSEMLIARGYELSGNPVVSPGVIERFKLSLNNRLGRFSFAAKRNGFGLAVLEILARRLPITRLKDYVRRALQEKARAHLR
ncbi:MAG: hypothetical protein DHS20C05_04710 [Hyphococcus sp.]|nr:MAG: hypothetical protein DHS20C05_04710 [Marinicaulis sp.]